MSLQINTLYNGNVIGELSQDRIAEYKEYQQQSLEQLKQEYYKEENESWHKKIIYQQRTINIF